MIQALSGARDEFALIADLFAPLAASFPGALGLGDDAALMDMPAGTQAVLTMDAMVAGVHFFADDPAELIARKLVRVNLSDLAAKGAEPVALMLAAAFPRDVSLDWLRRFAAGLAQDVAEFQVPLIGGDTVATPGPLTLTLTAIGRVPTGQALLRSGAAAGDRVWLSGTLGDAALGLACRRGDCPDVSTPDRDWLQDRYLLPRPRVGLGPALRGVASAAMDVSDGLVQDLGHLCRQSGLGAVIDCSLLPLSAAAGRMVAADKTRLASILGGGDDYEILFTAPVGRTDQVAALAQRAGVTVTAIGLMVPGQGVRVEDGQGRQLEMPVTGWRHFTQSGGQQ